MFFLPCIRVVLMILLIISVPFSGIAAQEKVRLTNGEWAPYQSQHLPDYGAASHLMTEAFAAAGVTVEYGFFPWNRAMLLVERGAWDGTFMWVLTPERERKFLVSDPLFTIREVIFYSSDRPVSAKAASDMKGMVMGGLDSSAFGVQFNDMIENGDIIVARVRSNQQLFQMLASGRVDFVPELETSGYDAAREYLTPQQQKRISHLETLTHPWSYHLLISRTIDNGPFLIDAFNRGLAIIKENGKFEEIIGPYIRAKPIQ